MPALTMSAKEKHLVLHILRGVLIPRLYLIVETLPLCQRAGMFQLSISWVGAVDEAEIGGRLEEHVR